MKALGIILIVIGCILAGFVAYLAYQNANRTVSPVPQESGIKVIFITPTP